MVKKTTAGPKQKKYVEPTTKGSCPYCHKHVDSLEAHIHDKHKGEKLVKKKY